MKKYALTFILLVFIYFSYSQSQKFNTHSSLGFIENKGQLLDQNNKTNTEVLFYVNMPDLKVQLKKNGFSYEVYQYFHRPPALNTFNDSVIDASYKIASHRIDVVFEGSQLNHEIVTNKPKKEKFHYYTEGTPENGITGISSFNTIIYKNVYPGIDAEFRINNDKKGAFEYIFIVHPDGNPADIKIHFNGANNVSLNDDNIIIETSLGEISETIPASYIAENHKKVNVKYMQIAATTFGFSIPMYDKSKTLIIDPEPVLNWCTFFGGSQSEMGYRVFQTLSDLIYITGNTESTSNIASTGAHQTTYGGTLDAFLAKFDESGNLLWATYYGGSATEWGYALALNSSDDIFMLAETNSSSNIATSGAHQTTFGGGNYDAFLAKFNSSGIRQWSTYFGGSGWDFGESIAISNNDDIYIAGQTASSNAISTPGAHQTSFAGGGYDAYLARFNSNGVLQWSTYMGGNSVDRGYGLAISPLNIIYLTGHTASGSNIATPGAYQTTLGGSFDGYLSTFDTLGNRLWSTYFGQSGEDWAISVQVSINNNAYICGLTKSTGNMATPGSHQTAFGGSQDGFLAKFNATGQLQWSTYYGGSNTDLAFQLKTSLSENIYVVGETTSTNNISSPNAYQVSKGGGYDAFLVKFDSTGQRLWGTYFGGPYDDNGRGMHLGKTGNLCITGYTKSNNLSTPNAYQTVLGGTQDAFVAKFQETATSIEIPEDDSDNSVFIPNIFSPNKDGQNDRLFVYSPENNFKSFSFAIYNRWGEKVFETNNIEEGWDGVYKKQLAPVGVYIYTLKVTLNSGGIIKKNGNVTLVR